MPGFVVFGGLPSSTRPSLRSSRRAQIGELREFATKQCEFRLRALENQADIFSKTGSIIGK